MCSDIQERSSVINEPVQTRQLHAIFQQYRNDIDIYTEDKDSDKVFYVKLFKKLLEGTDIRVNDIHQLGCKNLVKEACNNDTDNSRKRLYIVDGDIFIQYEEQQEVPHLFVLESYCIENYVIDEVSVCRTAERFEGRRTFDEIKQLLNYDLLIEQIKVPLIDLFHCISIQSEFNRKFRIYHIGDFINSDIDIDINKIRNKIEETKDSLIRNGKITEEQYEETLQKREANFPYSKETLLKIVSGKNYLIPFFHKRINKCLSCNIQLPRESWKSNMVEFCNLSRLENLKNAIIEA